MIENDNKTKIAVKNLNLYYGVNQALFDITANLYENKIHNYYTVLRSV